MPESTDWRIEPVSRNVLVLRCDLATTDEPRPILLVGDAHWDNPHCDRDRLKADLDEAVSRNAIILIGGDFFCAMQGKYDKRASKDAIRPEHCNGNYLDSLVSTAAEWLEPYKDHIALICRGNHETAIERIHETNLTDRLVYQLRQGGSEVQSGGYTGYVRFQISRLPKFAQSLRLYYRHGHGGGGPVTMGKIDFNRYRMQADYDVCWAQHVHHSEVFDTQVAYLNNHNYIRHRTQWHIRTPSYKDEYGDGFGGFQIERGQGPRPKGGVWLHIYRIRTGDRERYEFHAERTRQ